MAEGLIIPALVLAMIGWAVPRALALVWPEGVAALFALAFVAAILMVGLAALGFVGLYLVQGVPLVALGDAGWGGAVWHFARLGLVSGLIWGPILVLSAAGVPKRWKKVVW